MNESTPTPPTPVKPVYADLANLTEDERIRLIGRIVTEHRKKVGFIVEDEAKAQRYIKRLMLEFPMLIVKSAIPMDRNLPRHLRLVRVEHKETILNESNLPAT